MGSIERTKKQRHGERGNTLYIVAASLFVFLGLGALAIDLASLYVARNEAQRAADAAALAGAKVFVESGCITSQMCAAEEGDATTRATEVGQQNLVEGQPPATITVSFNNIDVLPVENPQITVQVTSANLNIYFAAGFGVATPPTVGASATAEAYNPSGASGGGPTAFCTSCARPWLIANCDQILAAPLSTLCPGQASLLNPATSYGVSNPGCVTGGGVVGEPIDIKLQFQPALYGALDVDNPGTGNLFHYQDAITTCFTGATTCGVNIPLYTLPANAALQTSTLTGVENLLNVAGPGLGLGQDTIDTTQCPPLISAGSANPYGTTGVITTSNSIVTAYIFDGLPPGLAPATPGLSQPVTIVGFAQIFVTEVDLDAMNNVEVQGVILGVAGCGSNPGAGCGSGTYQGPTMLPVRLIQASN